MKFNFVVTPQPPERLSSSQIRAICKAIECLYWRAVVLEGIIEQLQATDRLNAAFGGPICTLSEIYALCSEDQKTSQLSKCIAPDCHRVIHSDLPGHIRSTEDLNHQFHRLILTGTFCFQCGSESSSRTLARHEKHQHGDLSSSRIENFKPFRTAFTRRDLAHTHPDADHVADRKASTSNKKQKTKTPKNEIAASEGETGSDTPHLQSAIRKGGGSDEKRIVRAEKEKKNNRLRGKVIDVAKKRKRDNSKTVPQHDSEPAFISNQEQSTDDDHLSSIDFDNQSLPASNLHEYDYPLTTDRLKPNQLQPLSASNIYEYGYSSASLLVPSAFSPTFNSSQFHPLPVDNIYEYGYPSTTSLDPTQANYSQPYNNSDSSHPHSVSNTFSCTPESPHSEPLATLSSYLRMQHPLPARMRDRGLQDSSLENS